MSLNPDIPKIAITPESEEDDNFLSLTEALTDLEGIDEDSPVANYKQKVTRKNKLKIKLTADADTTDYEDYEASDNDDNVNLIKHSTPISLDDMDLESSTYEESFKVKEMSGRGKNKLRTQNSTTQVKKDLHDECDESYKNLTDEELFNTDSEMQLEDIEVPNLDLEYYNDDVNVTEQLKLAYGNSSDDLATDNLKVNQLSSTLSLSPNLSDLTDVEVLYSDSNDELDGVKGKSRRRRRRGGRKYSATDVEDLEISDNEIRGVTQNKKSSKKQARVNTMAKCQSLNFESDNEENGYFRFPICKKAVKKGILKIPNFDTGLLTDTEDVEGELDDQSPLLENKPSSDISFAEKLDDIAAYCGQTTEVNTLLKDKHSHKRANKDKESSKQQSVESDDYRSEEAAYNEEKEKKSTHGICVSSKLKYKGNETTKEEIVTDCEDIDSSSDDESAVIPTAMLRENTTEEEDYVDDMFDYIYQVPEIELPPPSRNLVVLKENNPLPTVHIVPLPDNVPEKIQLQELIPTDEESISDAEDALETLTTVTTPEVPPLDFGFVDIIESFGQKLKVGHADNDSVTDTEELILDNKEKRRRAPKFKYLHEKSLGLKKELVISAETALLTDTEDIYLSEGNARETNYLAPRQVNDGATDIENLVDSSDDDKDVGGRPLSCTPQHMREMGGETVVAKEGAGPFSKEERISVNLRKKEIKQFAVSPTNTDTEEMVTSADEDVVNYSRAETATPNQVHQEFDGMSSSKVHAEILNKFDGDASSEVMYLKGGGYTERNTDVEYISDEEQEIEINYNDMILEDYIFIGCGEKQVSLNYRDGLVSFGIGKGNILIFILL